MTTETASERLARLRERVKAVPAVETSPDRFQIRFWFDAVCRNRNALSEAITYYHEAINNARPHMSAVGHLETMLAETPGLEHYYKGILVDAQQVRRWLEEMFEIESVRKYKWFLLDPESKRAFGDLKTTEIAKFVKADDQIASRAMEIRTIANVENHLLSVIETFTTRNINLSRISANRQAGLQDVWIDMTKGTNNV